MGSAQKFGAFDINKISNLFNGELDVDTVNINSPFIVENGKLILSSIMNGPNELTLPDGPDTLVGRDTADTLTNKILEAPNINSPLITAPTIDELILPTGPVTLVGQDTADFLTNKTLDTDTTTFFHSQTHKDAGSDPIALDELAPPTDTTTLDATVDAHGLCPKLSGVANEFLNAEGLWVEHIMDIFTAEMDGLVPMTMDAPPNSFLRSDATWAIPDQFTATNPGIVPQTDDVGIENFLRADATWAIPELPPMPIFDDVTDGLVPASGGGTTDFLRADGTWAEPPVPSVSGTAVLAKYVTNIDITNTGAETEFFNFSVPGNTLGTNKIIRVTLQGTYVANSGTPTIDFRIYYGATLMHRDTSFTLTAVTPTGAWRFELYLSAHNSTTIQELNGMAIFGARGAATTGLGDLSGSGVSCAIEGTAAVNSTTTQTFRMTAQWSAANIGYSWKRTVGMVELLS